MGDDNEPTRFDYAFDSSVAASVKAAKSSWDGALTALIAVGACLPAAHYLISSSAPPARPARAALVVTTASPSPTRPYTQAATTARPASSRPAPVSSPLPAAAPLPYFTAAAAIERPAWAESTPSQAWTWPAGMRSGAPSLRFVGPGAQEDSAMRRLKAWNPAAGADGGTEFFNDRPANNVRRAPMSLEEIRKLELDSLIKAKGASSGKGFLDYAGEPVALLTYADGRTQTLHYDPLVFDLRGDGVKTSSRKVLFDLVGYGRGDKIQWMNDLAAGTGILVFDAQRSGRAGKDGREVFGDRTSLDGDAPDGFANGFEALRGLVDKAIREGVLDGGVAASGVLDARALSALERAYGLKIRLGGLHGRTIALAQAGVRGIALSKSPAQRIENFDGRNNDLLAQPGAVFLRADGTVGTYMNIWLAPRRDGLGLKRVEFR